MSKMFSKKGKEPKKLGRDTRSDVPALPDRTPHSSHTLPPKAFHSPKSGYFSEAIEPQLPPRTTSPYPGTWKPPKAPAPLPPEPRIPKSNSNTGSFDDEYVAPGDLQDGGSNDMFGGNQMTSYAGHRPNTPPLSGDEDYAAPDELTHGHTNISNGFPSNYHAYKQNQVPSTPPLEASDSEDMYIAPDGEDTYDAPDTEQIIPSYNSQRMHYPAPSTPPMKASDTEDLFMGPDGDREETYDAPDDCMMSSYPTQRMNYHGPSTPPPLEPDEDYDTPDNLNPYLSSYPPPDPLIEDSYDVPDSLQLAGGHIRGPSTPPLPVTPPLIEDTEDTYDVPDREEFIPPPFSPPKVPNFKPQYNNTPSYLNNSNAEPSKPPKPVNELAKRIASLAPKQDLSPPPVPPVSPSKPSTRKPLVPTPASKPVQPPPPPQMTKLEDQIWFKKNFDRHLSENFLRKYNIDGGFIVRPSTKEGAGNYSFSIYYQGEIRHLKLRKKTYNNKYSVGEEKDNELEFDSVMDCVKYHRSEPLILKAGGEVCLEVLQ